ncbi:hypothetical protein GOP47_0006811 [Adiantum capillus-veneris]|uniref:Uncharacterized protein n=1 Tax=Adiantum capillus-veneris TaxID=13818 RepID=A0A9D4V3L2_ADICA|nr:hypothetical protein GOP47_0006811 [Adiantum capillus-veneris]
MKPTMDSRGRRHRGYATECACNGRGEDAHRARIGGGECESGATVVCEVRVKRLMERRDGGLEELHVNGLGAKATKEAAIVKRAYMGGVGGGAFLLKGAAFTLGVHDLLRTAHVRSLSLAPTGSTSKLL